MVGSTQQASRAGISQLRMNDLVKGRILQISQIC
jgi:hypothetical protein